MSSQNYKDFFSEAINQIHQEMADQGLEEDFQIWFNLTYIDDSISQINVSVPSEYMWLQMNSKGYIQKIEDKINELCGQNINIIHKTNPKPVAKIIKHETPAEIKKIQEEKEIIHNDNNDNKGKEPEKKSINHPQLRSDFTFENFIPGENSMYPYNASIVAAKNPGNKYNPILIYGGVGLGKTHLMQAIGNYIFSENQKSKISYLSAESFTNEFTSAIKSGTIDNFKKRYRNLDVLLLDDIQFLEGKEATQEELFHTFNSIYDRKGQIVFTSDRPIKEIKGFTERLSSRFSRGLNVDLQPPDYENRIAIIEKKLELQNKIIPHEVIEFVAKNCQTNVRDIEACITKLVGYAELVQKNLTVEIAQNLLRDNINNPYSGTITIENIQKVIANHYNVSVSDIKGKKKDRKFVIPRQIAMYVCTLLTEFSTTDIGIEFGGRDHTTVMHARNKVMDLLKTDSSLNSTINLLTREIKDFKK